MPSTPRARRALFLLSAWMALPSLGCAIAGPVPMALGQAEAVVCEGARVADDGAVTCRELRWATGGPLSAGFAQAIGGLRDTALRAAGAVIGVPAP